MEFYYTHTNKEILMNQLHDCQKEVQKFETTFPENEQTEALIKSYRDVYIKGKKLKTTLQKKGKQLKQIPNVEQEEK